MLEKVSSLSLNASKPKNSPAFKSNQTVSYPQVDALPSVTAQYGVKVPMSYSKVAELELPFNLKAHCYRLANGQRVVIVPKEGETVLKTYVGTGSMNEPDRVRGISHYIEHNLFNGSEGLGPNEFFKTASQMGAYTNASTSFATTDYVISSNLLNPEDLEKEIKIHSSMLETPKFAIDMLEKEKGIVNSEISMYEGSPQMSSTSTTIKNLYGIKSTSKELIAGSTDNITRLTREDVVDYYNNNYYPANMVTVITGDVNPDNTMTLISKYFSGTNKNTHPRKFQEFKPIDKTVRQDLYSDKTKSTYIEIGFNGPRNDDIRSKICYELVSLILDKQNNGKTENGLKQYNASAGMLHEKIGSRPQDPELLLCVADTNEENCDKVLQQLYNNIHALKNGADYDLDSYKKVLLNDYSKAFEKSGTINFIIGDGMLNGNLDSATNYERILKSITKEDIANFARQYLDLNKVAITVTHPEKESKQVTFTGAKNAINPDNVSRYRAANNFEILTNESATNMSSISFTIATQDLKTEHPSAGNVLSVMLGEGSKLRPGHKFDDDMTKKGIDLDFASSYNSLSAYSSCASEDMKESFDSMLEVLYNPNLTQENFEYAKKKVTENLSKARKTPLMKLDKELFEGYQRGITVDEMLADLEKLTLDDVKALYSHILAKGEGQIVSSAPFRSHPELKSDLLNNIAKLSDVQPVVQRLRDTYKPVDQSKVLTDVDTKEQAEIIEAFKFKTNRNIKDDVAVTLLEQILGGSANSRLFNDLREKQQLCYKVNAKVKYFGNTGVFSMNIGTTTDNASMGDMKNLQKSIDGFNKHVRKLKSEYVTPEELATAKLELKNEIYSNNETTFGKTDSLEMGLSSMYGPLTENEVLKVIDTITAEDIYNAANYIFGEKPTYSIVATEKTIKANEEYLKGLER